MTIQDTALLIHKLSKCYPPKLHALRNIDLKVTTGDFFALLGANGAGKSTIINIISSLTIKDKGKVHLLGLDIDTDFNKARRNLGVVPQEFNFNAFERVIDIVVNQAGFYGLERSVALKQAKKYLSLLGLWEKRSVRAIELSGGMKRRLMIARALLHEPSLLILDEPTAGVDIELRRTMWEFLRELNDDGVTIILTTHYLEEAEYLCRNVAVIDEGKIAYEGAMHHVLNMLSKQIFILDLEQIINKTPKLAGMQCRIVSERQIEVSVPKDININALFSALQQQEITVISIRPKTNKLEQMFLALTKNKPS